MSLRAKTISSNDSACQTAFVAPKKKKKKIQLIIWAQCRTVFYFQLSNRNSLNYHKVYLTEETTNFLQRWALKKESCQQHRLALCSIGIFKVKRNKNKTILLIECKLYIHILKISG